MDQHTPAPLELSDDEILSGIDESEARELEIRITRKNTFERRYSDIPEESERIMWQRADKLARRNPDSEFDQDDILSRYVVRFMKKRKHFKADEYTLERFTNLICNNIDAEIMPQQIKTRKRRRAMVWLDLALESHGATELDSDNLFVNESLALLARQVLASDVREAICRIKDKKTRLIGWRFMRTRSLRRLAATYGVSYSTFQTGQWERFRKAFKREWSKESQKNSVQSTPPIW